jgi:hypothetical protein
VIGDSETGDVSRILPHEAKSFLRRIYLAGVAQHNVVAFTVDDSEGGANIKTAETLELFAACESSYPLLSVRWGDGDIERAAETASAFLDVPSVTPQVILDKAKECFSALKSERGMMAVDFDQVELRCGAGPDIQWGRIVVVHVN